MLNYVHLFPSITCRPQSATAGLRGPTVSLCTQPDGGPVASLLSCGSETEMLKGSCLLPGQLVCLLTLGAERDTLTRE